MCVGNTKLGSKTLKKLQLEDPLEKFEWIRTLSMTILLRMFEKDSNVRMNANVLDEFFTDDNNAMKCIFPVM